jgi:hypothetical protein
LTQTEKGNNNEKDDDHGGGLPDGRNDVRGAVRCNNKEGDAVQAAGVAR